MWVVRPFFVNSNFGKTASKITKVSMKFYFKMFYIENNNDFHHIVAFLYFMRKKKFFYKYES
jgi:hypothetical protein